MIYQLYQLFLRVVVIAGPADYDLVKDDRSQFICSFWNRSYFFGWLGFLIGIIAITTTENWSSMNKLGPALGVALLTILHEYITRLITLAFE